MINSEKINITIQKKVFSFDLVSLEVNENSLKSDKMASDGYGDFYKIDGSLEPIFCYGHHGTVWFFFRKSYPLNIEGLTAEMHYQHFKNEFCMYDTSGLIISIIYKRIDPESDVLLDILDWLSIKPEQKKQEVLRQQAQFFSEKDVKKRRDFRFENMDRALSLFEKLKFFAFGLVFIISVLLLIPLRCPF